MIRPEDLRIGNLLLQRHETTDEIIKIESGVDIDDCAKYCVGYKNEWPASCA